mgnify:FL=1
MKTVIVTGGTKGLGKAIAKVFALHNYNLILTYLHDDASALQTKKELEQFNSKVMIVKSDVSDEQEVIKLLDSVKSKFESIDVLINNAGIAIDTTLEDKTVDNFKRILDTNLIGPFLTSKYIGQFMFNQGYGKIINISSTNAIDTYYKEGLDYDASKAGLNSLTLNFADIYAPVINVNAIACGWINTEMNKDMDQEFKDKEVSKILLNRFAEPEEIANVVYFLTTKEASYINGSIIRVDGGLRR